MNNEEMVELTEQADRLAKEGKLRRVGDKENSIERGFKTLSQNPAVLSKKGEDLHTANNRHFYRTGWEHCEDNYKGRLSKSIKISNIAICTLEKIQQELRSRVGKISMLASIEHAFERMNEEAQR